MVMKERIAMFNQSFGRSVKILLAVHFLWTGAVFGGSEKISKCTQTIVISNDAIAAEKTAAEELQCYLEKITGRKYDIFQETKCDANSAQILVGVSSRVRQLLPTIAWNNLKHDEIVMKKVGGQLILAGGRPRGTIYAVYTFLEDYCGVRWWTSTESYVPKNLSWKIPDVNVMYAPKIESRMAFYTDVLSYGMATYNDHMRFAAKLKLNGWLSYISPEYGDHVNIYGVHSFYLFLPPEECGGSHQENWCGMFDPVLRRIMEKKSYFNLHPEWYSLVDGKRTSKKAQLCLMTPDPNMREEFTKNVLAYLDQSPNITHLMISANDYHGTCECKYCSERNDIDGSPTGSLVDFVNDIGARIKAKHPDMTIMTLAYMHTRLPPIQTRLNAIVKYSFDAADHQHPWNSAVNAIWRDQYFGWANKSEGVFIWEYPDCRENLLIPLPNIKMAKPNIEFLANNNCKGIFSHGNGYNYAGDFTQLRLWLYAHLMWDPSKDQDTLIKEFLNGYYGAAGPYLKKYLDLTEKAWVRHGVVLPRGYVDERFMNLAEMNEATRLFDKAQTVVQNDPCLAGRVKRERLPLDCMWLLNYYRLAGEAKLKGMNFNGPKNLDNAVDAYISAIKTPAYEITYLYEGMSIDYLIKRLNDIKKLGPLTKKASLPPQTKGLAADAWKLYQSEDMSITRYGENAWLENDALASDGRAIRVAKDFSYWTLPADTGRWRIYAAVRVVKAASGAAFYLSVSDYTKATGVALHGKEVQMADVSDSLYHYYDLGVYDVHPQMIVGISPSAEPVYLDRLIFVQEKSNTSNIQ